ncbi:MAG TPA: tyrosine-type recombinase/integrase [Terracidiphilus sp.]
MAGHLVSGAPGARSPKAAGIPGKIGWHTFRHTFATLLKANGEDIKTVQELLRHANIAVTMNVYAQGATELKRQALPAAGRGMG